MSISDIHQNKKPMLIFWENNISFYKHGEGENFIKNSIYNMHLQKYIHIEVLRHFNISIFIYTMNPHNFDPCHKSNKLHTSM